MQASLYDTLSNLKFAVKTLGEKLRPRKSDFDYHNSLKFLSEIDTESLIGKIKINYNLHDLNEHDTEIKSLEEAINFLKKYFGPKSGLQATYCHGERRISKGEEADAYLIRLYYGKLEKQKGNTVKGKPYRTITLDVILSLNQK
mgnify:CR=1 FL=1